MLVSFDTKFIRRDQKQRIVGMARLTEPVRRLLVEPDKLDIKRHLHGPLLIYHALLADLMAKTQRNK